MSQPLAKIGVSGNEHDTCAFSSFGDWEPRFWYGRRCEVPGKSVGKVRRSTGTLKQVIHSSIQMIETQKKQYR